MTINESNDSVQNEQFGESENTRKTKSQDAENKNDQLSAPEEEHTADIVQATENVKSSGISAVIMPSQSWW